MSKKESETETDTPVKPKGKAKKVLMMGIGTCALLGAGGGAGIYASSHFLPTTNAVKEDPNQPKLVERSDEPPAPAAEGEDGATASLKVGTVAVKDDKARVDPRKFEITYFPVEQAFTANLADGSGFVQMGLSLSTYYDGKVIANIQRQIVPIRSAVLMILSEQDPGVVSTPAGKQMLQRQLTKAINSVLRQKEGFGGIDNVYFTSLVIQ
jgi:flagellar protein FliL